MKPLVELAEVSKVYNGGSPHAAIESVTLSVQAGEFAAIMGPSGSGKSTLLNLIAGLDHPTKGHVLVAGLDLGKLNEAELARYRRGRIGFIFQFFNLLNNLKVEENILIPAQLSGMPARTAEQRVRDLMDEFGIAARAREFPAKLSGGERQRVAIARALINDPLLLLADEPTGALDSRSGEQVMEQLVELNRGGQTVLLVTHDPKLATAYAARIISLRDGRVNDDTRLSAPGHVTPPDLVRVRIKEASQ